MNITEIQNTILDARIKGIPGSVDPFPLKEIKNKNWNILKEDLPMPIMVLKRNQFNHNLKTFAEYLKKNNLSIAPHGKTTMSPQIFSQQLDSGAWGITAGAINQIQVMYKYGVKKILLANQLLGKSHLKTISNYINNDSNFSFYCFIDSIDQFKNIEHNLKGVELINPINLLPEIGAKNGRTGIRSKKDFLELVEKIAKNKSNNFRFSGISSYEGIAAVAMQGSQVVHDFCSFIEEIINEIPSNYFSNLKELLITAGGSTHFDIVGERFSKLELSIPIKILLRSGCYITHDHGPYLEALKTAKEDKSRHWDRDLQPALEVWSYVQSIPEKNLAFLTMGKRDVPYDSGLPKPLKRFRPGEGYLELGSAEIFSTNDQHAFVKLADDHGWKVGDMICSGISHPCTAFDKWRFIPVVNKDYDVIDGILTFF
jgi:D-serine dehydratase